MLILTRQNIQFVGMRRIRHISRLDRERPRNLVENEDGYLGQAVSQQSTTRLSYRAWRLYFVVG